jgi:hypothetical protein
LKKFNPVDRADAGHVVVADDGVDREAGGEVERPEPIGVPAGRVDGVVEVCPDHAGVGDVPDVMEGIWRGFVGLGEQRIGEAGWPGWVSIAGSDRCHPRNRPSS